jgi:hypothetical protein
MSKILINYADITHYKSQEDNCNSGRVPGGFEGIVPYGRCDLDNDFQKRHKDILCERKGAGYWLWKPYIILKTLTDCNRGDFVFYNDSGIIWIASADPLINICAGLDNGIMLFHTDPLPGNTEGFCTKRDAFILMDCDSEKYANGLPLNAGIQLYRKCDESIEFVQQYLNYCTDWRIITDYPNTCGKDNYPGYKFHRHDQSVMSLLAKKYNLKTFRDPTQWGNRHIKPADGYKQLIKQTRKSD